MGKVLAQEFKKIKQSFIVIDHEDDMFLHANAQGILSIKGDATDSAFLASIGINKGASSIIALTNDDAVNLSIILTARSLNPKINIIARANNDKVIKKLFLAGANDVVSANDVSALIAAEYVGQSIVFDAIDDILLNNEGAVMDEIEIIHKSNYINHKLETIDFSKYNLTLIGVIDASNKNNFLFNPKKDKYIINEKDILIVIGHKESVTKFRVNLISSKPKVKYAK
jgi:voltage-gated potassium channel